ncbi:hypothetical protein BCV70DRAFT_198405 [Testicularia cyperi]|uniref:Uncharacterized protein n=1 Tax=Testicularia cyperi TaxID=1882483 RepID=A0A317XUU2_9BASI|nr:hypothetical protein BCV70DRAFT_198405 [Testicularia cyperi]
MYCLRWWIPLFLFPFPKTSPLFLILFVLSFTIHSKPCIYCALIITGLFATSANWYTAPTAGSTETALPSNLGASSPNVTGAEEVRTSESWFDLGHSGGSGFWNPIRRRPEQPSATSPSPLANSTHFLITLPYTRSPLALPKQFYLGLGRHGGMGVWINLAAESTS